jgi:hypothetical protein
MYFVAKPNGSNYLSGGASLLEEIDRGGFDATSKEIDHNMAKASASPTPGA